MSRWVVDIEADSLNPTRIWCIVCLNYDTDEEVIFTPENLHDFINFSSTVEFFIGHNFLSYDRSALNRLLKTTIKVSQVVDTLVLSRLFNITRDGGHSLESWGKLFKLYKLEHEDWSQYSPAMLERCRTDVRLNKQVYRYLLQEGKDFSKESIQIEHSIQYILEEQRQYGFYIDLEKATQLKIECDIGAKEIEDYIHTQFKHKYRFEREVNLKYTKEGRLSLVGLKSLGYADVLDVVGGNFSLIYKDEFNLSSPSQLVERLEEHGWIPTEFNKPTINMKKEGRRRGTPKVCVENVNTLPDSAPQSIKSIGTYLMLKSRSKLISNWIVEEAKYNDSRIHGQVFGIGATTHRMAHLHPNMGNIPSITLSKEGHPILGREGSYGAECRACFTVEDKDNRTLVGVDAKAIQLRVLAHYLNNPEFTRAVLEGDPHTYNQKAAGLSSRALAKTFIYAFLLGAGDAKLGSIVGGTAKDGEALRSRFMANTPGLIELKKQTYKDADRGYMIGLDGRRIPVKSVHFALSSYLQGGEAVIMKAAYIDWYATVKRLGLNAHPVSIVHDEFQIECDKDIANTVGSIVIQSIRNTTNTFNLRCAMDGEMKVGLTWAETH